VDDAPNEHDFFAAETRVVADLRSDVERPRRVVHKTLAGIVVACLLVGGWFVFNPTAETANAPDDTAESTHVVEQTSEGVVARLTLDADSPFQLPNEHKRTADGELELVSSTSSAGPSWLPLWLDDTPAVVVISDPSTPVCVVASVVDVDRSPLRIGATGTICAEQAIRASAQCDGHLVLAILTEAPATTATDAWAWRVRADSSLSSYRTELRYDSDSFSRAPRFQSGAAEIFEINVGEQSTACRRS